MIKSIIISLGLSKLFGIKPTDSVEVKAVEPPYSTTLKEDEPLPPVCFTDRHYKVIQDAALFLQELQKSDIESIIKDYYELSSRGEVSIIESVAFENRFRILGKLAADKSEDISNIISELEMEDIQRNVFRDRIEILSKMLSKEASEGMTIPGIREGMSEQTKENIRNAYELSTSLSNLKDVLYGHAERLALHDMFCTPRHILFSKPTN